MTGQISEDLFLELGELLNSSLDEVSILRTFCNKVLALFAAERVSILALDARGKNLHLAAWAGRYPEDIQGVRVPVGDGVAGWVAATGEPLLVSDVDSDPRFAGQVAERYRTRSFLSVPLRSRGKLLGVMNVTDTTSNDGFTEKNLRTLRSLALQVGMGMENLRLWERIGALSDATHAAAEAIQELDVGATDIESGLIPALVEGLKTGVGAHSHLVLIGEMGTNRAWIGHGRIDGTVEVGVLDFRSGFSLYQSLAGLPLHPPYAENSRLSELGFSWDLITDGRLSLLRSLLPPRHNLFGVTLSAVPDGSPELMDSLRVAQGIITQFGGLVLGGIFDRFMIRKLDHLKTELISTVSHELRTPLTSIQGFSEFLIRSDSIPESHIRYLHIINNESRRLNRLINDFLDLAKLESGQMTLIKEPLDPVEVVENAVRLLKPQSELQRAAVRLHSDSGLSSLIADRDRLEQALVNLIGNSLKHGGKGIHIDISVQSSDGHTVFEISDDGPGIPAEEIPMVFNRFYRGVREQAEDVDDAEKGTGLGLSLTKEIVEQHGGSISVTSSPNQKTIFRFSLPTFGLVSPQRGIVTWRPGDENLTAELANRLAEGKTVGVLTIHVNPGDALSQTEDLFSVEDISDIEDLISSTLGYAACADDFIQSRPQGEFVILTYSSLVDDYAQRLLSSFSNRFGGRYALAIGAAVRDGSEDADAEKLIAFSRQACQYIEKTQVGGYLKNRRM